MVSIKHNLNDIVSDRNSIIQCSLSLGNFAGIYLRKSPIFKDFVGIDFRESIFSGVKNGIQFHDFGKSSQNFLPAKISFLTVHICVRRIKEFLVRLTRTSLVE